MEHCPNRITYPRLRAGRGTRRLLSRLATIVVALVMASLIFVGEQWLFVDAAASGVELGVAVRATDAGSE